MNKNRSVKIGIAAAVLAMVAAFLTLNFPGPEKNASGGDVFEIKEKMFLAQTNDVYLNTGDYLGKTIKLEGLFKQQQSTERAAPYCFVIRYGPGCCGYDGSAGFEVAWENQPDKPYPDIDEWVEAVGVLKEYEEDGNTFLYISLSRLAVLNKKGSEFVSQ